MCPLISNDLSRRWGASDYESEGRTFESFRARHLRICTMECDFAAIGRANTVEASLDSHWSNGSAADRRVRLAAPHIQESIGITWLAFASTSDGTVTPSRRAVCRLTTNSWDSAALIGRSPGLAPLRILSA